MTRREWLKQNPRPRAAGSLRGLLEELQTENNLRTQLESAKGQWTAHLTYWNQQAANARAVGDTVTLNHANAELKKAQDTIADIDRQLTATAELPKRISDLQVELGRAAKCPTHQTDLLHHKNRPEDLFLCERGPHFFLWTKVGAAAALSPVELTKPLPELDGEMSWL